MDLRSPYVGQRSTATLDTMGEDNSEQGKECAVQAGDIRVLESAENTASETGTAAQESGVIRRRPGRQAGSKLSRAIKLKQTEAKIIALARKGLGQNDIARAAQCSETLVKRTRKRWAAAFAEIGNVKSFRDIKSEIFDAVQIAALKSLVKPETLAKGNPHSLAFAAKQLYDMGRLERGLSTSNNAVSFVHKPA